MLPMDYTVILYFGIYPIDDIDLPVDIMCDRANLALQTVKGNYLKRYAFYNDELRASILSENEMRSEMNAALEHSEFKIYYQPVYSVSSETPVSAEALVRWQHPTKGLISPAQLFRFLNATGLLPN